jgi:hypothetical protein
VERPVRAFQKRENNPMHSSVPTNFPAQSMAYW